MARESLQRKLDRVRPPRVRITYDTALAGDIETREIPFVIGVMGDYSGMSARPPLGERSFQRVDFDTFDQVLAELAPRACFKIPSSLTGGELYVDLTFRSMEDFEPEHVLKQLAPLDLLRKSGSPEASDGIARHLDSVLHAREFQALESAWRTVSYLVSQTESSSQLEIKLLDVTKSELLKDLQRSPELEQSGLFKLVYKMPYSRFGADPFGILVGDFAFGHSANDVEVLSRLAALASECHAPFVADAAPQMFGIESFRQLADSRDPARVFESVEYMQWRAFRESEDARYVALALPRFLLRAPYGMRPGMPDEFQYQEDTRAGEHLLWGNAAFAFAGCVANAFTRYGWCGAIRGAEGGGLVQGLPTWVSHTAGDKEIRSGVEVMISDRREKELADLGFLPLVQCLNTDRAAFFSVPSCRKPTVYMDARADTNSRLSCQLPYTLTASRFMQYFKVMARDRLGSYHTRGDWERYFNKWIQRYVMLDDLASPAIQATYPLREARIDVAEDPGRPGVYRLVAFLRPTFQLDELSGSLRFVGRIP